MKSEVNQLRNYLHELVIHNAAAEAAS